VFSFSFSLVLLFGCYTVCGDNLPESKGAVNIFFDFFLNGNRGLASGVRGLGKWPVLLGFLKEKLKTETLKC